MRHVAGLLCDRFDVAHAIPVDHGSTAIRAALRALRLVRDRSRCVGAPCNVWRGVYSAVGFSGADRLRLVDVDPSRGVVGASVSEDIDTLVAVDGYCVRSPIERLRETGIAIIEDASLSQAPSRDVSGRLAAEFSVMSFQSNKLLSCGEGGVVLTDDDELAEVVEACVCDGRTWLSAVADVPSIMGFNGMLADPAAKRLVDALRNIHHHLGHIRSGALRLQRAEPEAVPAWVEADLLAKGQLFALPTRRSAEALRSSFNLPALTPPAAPDAPLNRQLNDLPIPVEVCGRAGADEFASSTSLTPHWLLAELGRLGPDGS